MTGTFEMRAALGCHDADRAWLRSELAKPFEGDTVVITTIHPTNDPCARGFRAILSPVRSSPTCLNCWRRHWSGSNGHHRYSSAFVEHGRRVVCNPSGYPLGLNSDFSKGSQAIVFTHHRHISELAVERVDGERLTVLDLGVL